MIKSRPPVAVIAGPTASGKSALALALAERTGGVIINADSAQVYADLETLSARPSRQEMARAPHRLFGSRDAAEPYSAAEWASDAKAEIAAAHASARLPILVGGTGLYLRTLLDGIAPVPKIDPAVRTMVRVRTAEENWTLLVRLDPQEAERLNQADTTRIARALEVVTATGRSLSYWRERRTGGVGEKVELRAVILLPPRPWLYARCDLRFAKMLDDGAIAEVRALLQRGLDPQLPAMRAIGVRDVAAFLNGKATLAQCLASGAQATRNYAKRQYTWFAHQPPAEWVRFIDPVDDPIATDRALALLAPKR